MNTYDLLTKKDLTNVLGSFWRDKFNDEEFLSGFMEGLSMHDRQLDQNLQEITKVTGLRRTDNGMHVELWRPIVFVIDRESGGYYPLKYQGSGAIYGDEDGHQPFHGKAFKYGDFTDFKGPSLEDELEHVALLVDSFNDPSFVLVDGEDFELRGDRVVFLRDPVEIEGLEITTSVQDGEDYFMMWGFHCEYDLHYAANQWGYLLSLEQDSSAHYNKLLWAIWKSRRFGLTRNTFNEIMSLSLNCPVCLEDEEVVEDIVQGTDGGYSIITDLSVYQVEVGDTPIVIKGDVVHRGDFLSNKVDVVEPETDPSIHSGVKVLSSFSEDKLFEGEGMIKTNYIHFNADIAPSTIRKNVTQSYEASYASVILNGQQYEFKVSDFNRFGANDFSLEIKASMIPGEQTQLGELQVFTTDGSPYFKEPFTTLEDPISGVFNFFTDRDDIEKIDPDIFVDKVDVLKRILLISMFKDREANYIKKTLDNVNMLDNTTLAIIEVDSMSVYPELPTEGLSLSSIEETQLFDYDMVLLNTSSGVTSIIEDGEVRTSPSILDTEFTQIALQRTEAEIKRLEAEILTIDLDMAWVLNYLYRGETPTDTTWLNFVPGAFGTPRSNTPDGEDFYKYGLFSQLDVDSLQDKEKANAEANRKLSIPQNPWNTSSGVGLSTSSSTIPVYMKDIEVTSQSPVLETSLVAGEYIYKVFKVQKND